MRAAWLIGLVCAVSFGAPPVFQLPSGVTPLKHSLRLTIDPSQPTMEGRIEIALDVASPTRQIWLNARGVLATKATINDQQVKIDTGSSEFLGFETAEPVPAGSATLVVEFQSKLDDKLAV